MSTIAYRNSTMAADTRAYSGGRQPTGTKCKIRWVPGDYLIGASSSVPGACEAVMNHIEANLEDILHGAFLENLPGIDSFTALLIAPGEDGPLAYLFEGKLCPSGPIQGEFFAIGSGSEFALGAMEMGAEAHEAVLVACRLDPWSDLPIDTLSQCGEQKRYSKVHLG